MVPTAEPERIRWVRYAADCAEHVLHLTGSARPQAEAAIRAARAWADDPTEERREAARQAADAVPRAFNFERAARAAVGAAYAVYAKDAIFYAAGAAADAAFGVGVANYCTEGAWQAERRRFYGLRYTAEAFT